MQETLLSAPPAKCLVCATLEEEVSAMTYIGKSQCKNLMDQMNLNLRKADTICTKFLCLSCLCMGCMNMINQNLKSQHI